MGDLIAKLYRVRLTEQGVGKYLSAAGACRSSVRTSGPSSRTRKRSAAVRSGARRPGRRSARKAKAEGGEVLFADQVGIRSDQVTGRTWGAKGSTPVVRRTGQPVLGERHVRDQHQGPDALHGLHRELHAEVMCRFLDRLAGHFDRKVHLVVDGHSRPPLQEGPRLARRPPGRRRAALPAVVLARTQPRRAGQRRPQAQPPHAHRARNQAELAAEARRFFRRRQRQPHIVRGYFGGPHVRYVLNGNPMSF